MMLLTASKNESDGCKKMIIICVTTVMTNDWILLNRK